MKTKISDMLKKITSDPDRPEHEPLPEVRIRQYRKYLRSLSHDSLILLGNIAALDNPETLRLLLPSDGKEWITSKHDTTDEIPDV